MKKLILMLLVILGSLNFGENLDRYESKRVFDKIIEIMLTGDYNKYKDDPEMSRFYEKETEDPEDKIIKNYMKGSRYRVLEVQEKEDRSLLTVEAIYRSYEDITLGDIALSIQSLEPEISESDDEGLIIANLSIKICKRNESKSKLKKEIFEVEMTKNDSLWELDYSLNPEFAIVVYPGMKELIYYLLYITETEENIEKQG